MVHRNRLVLKHSVSMGKPKLVRNAIYNIKYNSPIMWDSFVVRDRLYAVET